MPNLQKKSVFNINISIGSYLQVVESILHLSQKKESSYVCVANVHMTVEAIRDPNFAEIVNSADITTADGMPIVQFLKRLKRTQCERVAGMDLLPSLLAEIERRNLSVFFFGGTETILSTMQEKALKQYPNLNIVGTHAPPFTDTIDEDKEIIDDINHSNPDFVFVSLGCPKQEKWMNLHVSTINACMIGLGGAFLVYSDQISRAPVLMSKLSLEWLYRLIKEPRRLWKRYLITNTIFIIKTLQFMLLKLIGKEK